MEGRLLVIILLGVAVAASGCTKPKPKYKDNRATNQNSQLWNGLQIETFKITDKTLRPGQRAIITLKAKNYIPRELDPRVFLYNTGALNVSEPSCTSGKVKAAKQGVYPGMRCTWEVEAPGGEAVRGFPSKQVTVKLHLEYRSRIKNRRPLKLEFKPALKINRSKKKAVSFGNPEVSVTMETEAPVAVETGGMLTFKIVEDGKGRLGSNLRFNYTPENLFKGCPETDKPVIGNKLTATCRVQSSQKATRNLFLSTSYKYIKEPTLDIRLVNNQ
ncbi:MAG: hypothetical protein ABEJ83_05340 [Candidatus Nanohaloarchaea archaeon]